jgi:hypothetical protein
LALPAAGLAALPKKPLLEPLFKISREVFKPAQGSHIDLHMLAMFFHDRQIEELSLDKPLKS